VADVVVAFDGESIVVGSDRPTGASRPNTSDLPLADRDLSRATTVASGPAATSAWAAARAEWKALTAVAYTGLAARAIEIGVDYVMERRQFGVPVGSFQAVQHGLADAATHNEGAVLLANRATWALETQEQGCERLASMALLFSAETARSCTDRALHYHGGYGFAEEYDIQLFYRRAAGWLLQLGAPAAEYAWLADEELGPRSRRDVA
jgi:alkylation response protein AidB-like acyl-CoA dehydrogenase